ncbi:14648_t:CDS:2 [Funneliformis caledonium]|uniref:14648_t:CDS:1 n=1 Tax=Funneliformis caledonium TaxID=1117310 RepID=A0A9N9EM57_9GLOM|nr:14648_t:CDS:2 [Funneliformis caledonium]
MAQVVTETVSGKIPSTTPPGTPPGTTPSPKPGTTNGTTLCSVSDYTIVTVPLQQLKNNFRGLNVTVSGTVSIIDGCTFEVTGFTYSFAATGTYWFGSNYTDPNAEAMLVSPTPVGQYQSAQSIKFKLTPSITFNDFNVLNLYSIDEKAVFGQAVLKQSPPEPETFNEPPKSLSNKLSFDLTKIFVSFLLSYIWIM